MLFITSVIVTTTVRYAHRRYNTKRSKPIDPFFTGGLTLAIIILCILTDILIFFAMT